MLVERREICVGTSYFPSPPRKRDHRKGFNFAEFTSTHAITNPAGTGLAQDVV